MRELILDTETTGLEHQNGDRIVEIGIVEMNNYVNTGNFLHLYINPERRSDPGAERIHGLSTKFLSDKPKFCEVADQIHDFIGDSKIIIHNAPFDLGFLNSEFSKCNLQELELEQVIDTLILSKKKYPGQPASLDALCRRFKIDISAREKHGALLDANLLSLVYLELMGGNQTSLIFSDIKKGHNTNSFFESSVLKTDHLQNKIRPINNIKLDQKDYEKHKIFIDKLPNSIWSKIIN